MTASPQQTRPMVSDQEWFDGAKEKLTWREIGPRTKRKHDSFGGCEQLHLMPNWHIVSDMHHTAVSRILFGTNAELESAAGVLG